MGSIIALLDADGVVTTSYAYDAFGNVVISGSEENAFQYTGRENDGTGLYYYRARYYSPGMRRFVGEDYFNVTNILSGAFGSKIVPFRAIVGYKKLSSIDNVNIKSLVRKLLENRAELNLYAYVQNNPTNFIDPTGYKCDPAPYLLCLLWCDLTCDLLFGEFGPPAWILCATSCHAACEPQLNNCGCD